MCHLAFLGGHKESREFWFVFPHIGCGGDLGMDMKEKEEYYFFLTVGFEGPRGPRKVTVTHWP